MGVKDAPEDQNIFHYHHSQSEQNSAKYSEKSKSKLFGQNISDQWFLELFFFVLLEDPIWQKEVMPYVSCIAMKLFCVCKACQ